jgi:hypothetical protein
MKAKKKFTVNFHRPSVFSVYNATCFQSLSLASWCRLPLTVAKKYEHAYWNILRISMFFNYNSAEAAYICDGGSTSSTRRCRYMKTSMYELFSDELCPLYAVEENENKSVEIDLMTSHLSTVWPVFHTQFQGRKSIATILT